MVCNGYMVATNGFTSTISNAIPVWGTTSIGASVTTFATNNFSANADAFLNFNATTVTGVGLCGTNGGATSPFYQIMTSLTGGSIHVRYGSTVSFTNGITAGSYNWTY